ncbi:MAG: hypothetical protein K9K64_11230 [Desulfohalobiaceae bacterium]|nr:hypothetical protein [Desulfohalobiaceae bacterium]
MQRKFKQALKDVTDICKFEHWLRFYYLKEQGDQLLVSIPEEDLAYFEKEYERFAGLAKKINHQFMTPEISQKTLIEFISTTLDGPVYDHSLINSVLNSKSFEAEITAFHIWSDVHADQLEGKVMDFKDWMQLFEAWKRTEKGQNLLRGLTTPESKTTSTTQ